MLLCLCCMLLLLSVEFCGWMQCCLWLFILISLEWNGIVCVSLNHIYHFTATPNVIVKNEFSRLPSDQTKLTIIRCGNFFHFSFYFFLFTPPKNKYSYALKYSHNCKTGDWILWNGFFFFQLYIVNLIMDCESNRV